MGGVVILPTVSVAQSLTDAVKLHEDADKLREQARYAEAEPLYKRAQAIYEQAALNPSKRQTNTSQMPNSFKKFSL